MDEHTQRYMVGARVIWNDGEGDCPGAVTAMRPNGDVIVKLDTGGAFQVPPSQLHSQSPENRGANHA